MRADETSQSDRIRHPYSGDIVEVTGRVDKLNRTIVHFRAKGQRGHFTVTPQHELEDCS